MPADSARVTARPWPQPRLSEGKWTNKSELTHSLEHYTVAAVTGTIVCTGVGRRPQHTTEQAGETRVPKMEDKTKPEDWMGTERGPNNHAGRKSLDQSPHSTELWGARGEASLLGFPCSCSA